jgi:ribose transport system permease protein
MSGTVRGIVSVVVAAALVGGLWAGYQVPWPNGFDRYLGWMVVATLSLAAVFATLELSRRNALRLAGVLVLLGILLTTLATTAGPDVDPFARSNVFEVLNRHGALGVIAVGAALVIITGGIDLSIGSVLGLAAVAFGVLLERGYHPVVAVFFVLLVGCAIGAVNGLLVTRLRLQSFLVTLCGMFVYRGLARELSPKQTGLVAAREAHPEHADALNSLRDWLVGKEPTLGALEFPAQLVVMLAVVGVLALFLHKSAYGRYWLAIGYNDQAARFAGVNVNRQRLVVFVAGSALAALGGILSLLSEGSADPMSVGNSLELYAITAAVLGGVSLKGGEGTALGIALGALVQPLIKNLMIFLEIPSRAEPWVMGLILLLGTIADEVLRRRSGATR